MQDLSVEGVRQMFGGQFFEAREKILLLGEALKFEGIFPKKCIKIIDKISEKFNENYLRLKKAKYFSFSSSFFEHIIAVGCKLILIDFSLHILC